MADGVWDPIKEQANYWSAQEKELMEEIRKIDQKKDPGAYAVALGLHLVVARLGTIATEVRSVGWGNAISPQGHGAIEASTMQIKGALDGLADAVRASREDEDE